MAVTAPDESVAASHSGGAGPSGVVDGDASPDLAGPDRDLRLAWRWIGLAAVVACCAAVLWQLDPQLLLRDTTSSGGDLGAHVWFPAYLRDHLLPHWRLAGWSQDWYAGFPAGQFYFPLPALLIVGLGTVVPYNVAFKLVSVSGALAMPAAAYAFGRGLRLRRPIPELLPAGATVFLFFKGIPAKPGTPAATIQFNQRIMGGPIVSTLAGEFSFAIALSLALCFLGALAWTLETRRRAWLPAVLLAATVLSHVVVALFAVVGGVVLLAFRASWGGLRRGIAIGATGALLTALWTIPFVATLPYTTNMHYERLTDYVDYLFPSHFVWVYPFAGLAAVVAAFRRDRGALALVVLTACFAAVFRLWPELHAWNLRFLPFWYLGVLLLGAVGAADVVRLGALLIGRGWVLPDPDRDATTTRQSAQQAADARLRRVVHVVVAGAAVLVITAGTVAQTYRTRGFLDFWAEWNYSGYQDTSRASTQPKAYPEYRSVVETMRRLPAGRALWEGGPDLDRYGTPLSLMLLPYWTHGHTASMEGLYFEASATTPYHFMAVAALSAPGNASNPVRGLDYRTVADFSLGVHYLRLLGVRYYMAHSKEARARADTEPGLRLVARVPDRDHIPPNGWNVYEVRGHALVAPLAEEPVVVRPRGGHQSTCFGRAPAPHANDPVLDTWECTAAGWWNDPARLDRPLAAAGPASWLRAAAKPASSVPARPLPPVRVLAVREREDSVSFEVSRTGVPVVVRTSYFPGWQADGARGPWRITPNFMVVVPTARHVRLHYERTGWDRLGLVLSGIGLVALAALVWSERSRRSPPIRAARRGEDRAHPGGSRARDGGKRARPAGPDRTGPGQDPHPPALP